MNHTGLHEDGLPPRERFWAVLAISVGLALTVINNTLVNVALPVMAKDLGASAADSVWVVSAFQLAMTVSLLPFASLGDIFGYRRVYIAGLVVFVAASLACAFATSLEMLVLARVVQGLGCSGAMSVNTALVRFAYPRARLGRGLSFNVLVVAVSSAAGPSLAAAILAVKPWPWLFLVNVPLGVVTLFLAWSFLPRTPHGGYRFDWLSALLTALTFGALVSGIDSVGHAQHPLLVGAELAVAILLGTALIRREAPRRNPLLPVDLFRRRIFALSVATSFCSFTAQGIAFVSLPFWFHDVIGRTQVETGLLLSPWPVAIAIFAPFAGRLADRYPAGILSSIGLAALAAGLVLVMLLPPAPGAMDIVWRLALCGMGFGFFQTPNNRAMVDSAPRERSGAVGGIMSTARLLGQTVGAALVAAAFALTADAGGTAAGTQLATAAAAGFAAVAGLASVTRLAGSGNATSR